MEQSAPFRVWTPEETNAQDVFGWWQITAAGPASGLATSPEIGSVWRVELPDDPQAAEDLLKYQAYRQAQAAWYLPAARRSLEHDLDSLDRLEAGLEFSAQTGINTPRGVLAVAYQYSHEQASYGLLDSLSLDPQVLDRTSQEVGQFAALVRRTVSQFALVETASAGKNIAKTRIAWSGDAETWWESGSDQGQFPRHNQVLAQALVTRQHWLRFLLLLTSGIVRTAAVLATGPFSLVAIWATWKYLQQVIAAFQKIRKNTQVPI